MSRSSAMVVAALSGLLVAGCFYTDPINREPIARITKLDAGPHHIGDSVRFSAKTSSDDSTEARWRVFQCSDATPPICQPLSEVVIRNSIADPYEVNVGTRGEVRLELVVTDDQGAQSTASYTFSVENRAPSITAQVQGDVDPRSTDSYVLGLPIDIFATAGDDDGDELELSWAVTPPVDAGSNPDNVVFTASGPDSYEFVPDVAGTWAIDIRADDGQGGVVVHTELIAVAIDHPPCIGLTDPDALGSGSYILDHTEAPRRFAVLSVTDALDSYPRLPGSRPELGEATFTWQIASPDTGGDLVEVSGHTLADTVLDPSAFSPTDRVTLRVEVADRNDRPLCSVSDATCELEPGCFQRLSWEIEIR